MSEIDDDLSEIAEQVYRVAGDAVQRLLEERKLDESRYSKAIVCGIVRVLADHAFVQIPARKPEDLTVFVGKCLWRKA